MHNFKLQVIIYGYCSLFIITDELILVQVSVVRTCTTIYEVMICMYP